MGRLVLTLLLLSVVSSAAGQVPSAPPVFRSGASLVTLNVSVMDRSRFVTNLTKADFAVYEDGVQQQVTFFESKQVPIDLILMLDTSASMSDKMEAVHLAAINFLRALRPGDRGAVVSFSDTVQILETLTSDRAKLEQAVRQTVPSGGTALNNAIYIGLREFGSAAKGDDTVRRKAIAVLTDGEDTTSLVSFDDVMELARKAGVNIYTIALRSPATEATGRGSRSVSGSQFSLKSLAQETGAEAFFPAQVSELQGVYATIAQELTSQYSIGYSSSNTQADSRFRRIVVRVVSHPELRLRTRTGYTAAGGALDSVGR